MAEAPQAMRIRRPSWRDPRLGVGIVLVAASVGLGSWLVARSGETIEVYRAPDVLVAGQELRTGDLDIVAVQIADSATTYLDVSAEPGDVVVLRTIGAGELVPLSALGDRSDLDGRTVAIPSTQAATAYLERGHRADLWVAWPDTESSIRTNLPPELLLEHVDVLDVQDDTSLFAGTDHVFVQVMVPESELAEVLAALSSGADLTLVPRPGG